MHWWIFEAPVKWRAVPDANTLNGAVKSENLELIKWLNSSERGKFQVKTNPLHLQLVAGSGNIAVVRFLIEEAREKLRLNHNVGNIFDYAIESSNPDLVKWLTDPSGESLQIH